MASTNKITYNRGTTYTITHVYNVNGSPSVAGVTLFFTVKTVPYDSSAIDTTAIVKKNIAMSGATNVITVLPTDIPDTVVPGNYYYDLKVLDNTGAIYLVDNGSFVLTATPTNRES